MDVGTNSRDRSDDHEDGEDPEGDFVSCHVGRDEMKEGLLLGNSSGGDGSNHFGGLKGGFEGLVVEVVYSEVLDCSGCDCRRIDLRSD